MTASGFDVIVIGAGAAGLFCAAEAGRRGRRVLVIDHARRIGEKIRISGGGRCNFTNIHTAPDNFLSQNPKFCISALKRFSPQDFIDRLNAHGIAWHEKTLGQLFCNDSAQQIIDMLMSEAGAAGVVIRASTPVRQVLRSGDMFRIETDGEAVEAPSLVVATGGLSIPKIGATGFGYDLARQFGLGIVEPRAGLVPLTFAPDMLAWSKPLSGVSLEADVAVGNRRFREGLLFTHRGLSGPSILQISNYWREGMALSIDLVPGGDAGNFLLSAKRENGGGSVVSVLSRHLPRRFAIALAAQAGWTGRLCETADRALTGIGDMLHSWPVHPAGTEGYRTAEVTLGGVDTAALDSRTMMARAVPGLFFIGEVVDVTGWLGGYNFQWAWASATAAGQAA